VRAGEGGQVSGEKFYRMSDMKPPVGVAVVAIWCGRRFDELVRVAHPQTKREAWLVRDVGAVFLPLDRDEAAYSARCARQGGKPWEGYHTIDTPAPELWRPQKPEAWRLPLPEPVAECEPRMWSSRTKFQAVDDAEVADLAREMEADRESARAGGERRRRKDAPPERQWWLDPSLVTYSPPGSITLREAEGRLMRAFIANRAESLSYGGGRTFADVLAAASAAVPSERVDATSDGYVFAQPTQRDGGEEMLRALGWFTTLRNGEGEALALGAWSLELRALEPALTWRAIARRLVVPEDDARRLHAAALAEILAIANGRPSAASRRQAERLEAVRQANRHHRIAAKGIET
jgi:hypothetical protein